MESCEAGQAVVPMARTLGRQHVRRKGRALAGEACGAEKRQRSHLHRRLRRGAAMRPSV